MGRCLDLLILKCLELTGNLSVHILVSLKVSVNLGVTVVSLNYMILLNKLNLKTTLVKMSLARCAVCATPLPARFCRQLKKARAPLCHGKDPFIRKASARNCISVARNMTTSSRRVCCLPCPGAAEAAQMGHAQ